LKGDDINAYLFNFPDDCWHNLDLPHDWSIEGPFDPKWASGTGYLPGGIGWYRKHFTLDKFYAGKKVFVYFEGVYSNSEVWINDISLGKRPNGYISFYYEISNHIRFGSDNVIAVKVDHTKYADSRWYTGSGIYRNVKIIVTEPLYFKPWGVYTQARAEELDRGLLEIEVTLVNDTSTISNVAVKNELFCNGKMVGESEQKVTIDNESETIVRGKIDVLNPHLWDVNNPELYVLISSIIDGEQVIDSVETNIGFRNIRFDSNLGFFLNNRNMKLKGICMHHDAGCLGAAVPIDVLTRRLEILKELGCNAIRTSHNAFSPDFYRMLFLPYMRRKRISSDR
jgi:beta-galactosidase/beta-glucuronidase